MKINKHIIKNPERYIPKGMYCYIRNDNEKIICPFWDIDKTKPEQENGYCYYLKKGDWENEGFNLLWDQCKECGVNECFCENTIKTKININRKIAGINYEFINAKVEKCMKCDHFTIFNSEVKLMEDLIKEYSSFMYFDLDRYRK